MDSIVRLVQLNRSVAQWQRASFGTKRSLVQVQSLRLVLNAYQKTFLIRFLAYFGLFMGLLGMIVQFGPPVGAEFNYRKNLLFGVHYTIAAEVIKPSPVAGSSAVPTPSGSSTGGGFGDFSNVGANQIVPVSTDFGIVIEKIDANAKVIANVDPANQAEYSKALALGVAEAKGSTAPGQPGNLYIFSHSTDAPWNVARYNAIFYLLRELTKGDRVVIFYQGRRYDYIVFDKTITKPSDLTFLANRYDKPVLTLQTCDPPGTSTNRLIVRAQLAGS